VADKQNRKGGDLAVYVGHFTSMRVSTFSSLVAFKKAARRSLVELRFDKFDDAFAKKLDGVSDGEGVVSKGKTGVKTETKTEGETAVKTESASSSGNGGGQGRGKGAPPQTKLIEFKFRSCETYLVKAGEWEGVLHVPMLQDQATGRLTLANGKTTSQGKVIRTDFQSNARGGPESFTVTFERKAGSPIHAFNLGYTLEYFVEESVCLSLRPHEADEASFMTALGSESVQFMAKRLDVKHLDAWEKHAGGLLQARAYGEFEYSGDDSDWEGNSSADYKIKLYTVLSAHKPDEKAGGKAKQVKYDKGAAPDWDALTRLVGARFPKKSADWAGRAVEQYKLFLELKIEHADWDSQKFSPSGPLDEVWHAHLSFVDRYQSDILALTQGARRVIEHSPVLGDEAHIRYEECHKVFLARMKRARIPVDKEFWPTPKESRDSFKEAHDGDSDDHLDTDFQPSCG